MKYHRHSQKNNNKTNKNREHNDEKIRGETSLHTVRAHDLSTDGSGVARMDNGSVVFVEGLLPGEQAQVVIHSKKSSFQRARIREILEPSTLRQIPPCPYFGTCGGCQIQHLSFYSQTTTKAKWFLETLKRIGKWDEKIRHNVHNHLEIVFLKSHHYRRRIKLHIKNNIVGLSQQKSDTIIPIENCFIAHEKINENIPLIRQHVSFKLELTLGDNDKIAFHPILVECEPNSQHADVEKKIFSYFDAFSPLNTVTKHSLVKKIKFSRESFVQPHIHAMECYLRIIDQGLSDFLNSLLRKKKAVTKEPILAWDLYAGSGVFTSIPHKVCQALNFDCHTKAIEGVPQAIESLNSQKQFYPLETIQEDVSTFLEKQFEEHIQTKNSPPQIVITDPPRTGMGIANMQKLIEVCHKECCIIYVSCDPACFARDCALLFHAGFQLQKTVLIDAFAQTTHYEVIGFFWRGTAF